MSSRQLALARNELHYHGKPCRQCGNTKRTTSKSMCVVCNLRHARKWAAANKERKAEIQKKYRAKPEVKRREAEYTKAYKRAHPEKAKQYTQNWRQRNRQKYLDSQRNYYQRKLEYFKAFKFLNRHKHCANEAKRRSVRKSARVSWADECAILEFYLEAQRRTELTGTPHHVDHILPLQGKTVCGLHVETNLRVVTREENLSKGNRITDAVL